MVDPVPDLTEPASSASTLRSRRWPLAALATLLLLTITGLVLGLRPPAAAPTTVAVVDADTGATRMGAKVVAALQQSDEFDWEVVDPDSEIGSNHLAVVTIPEDFSDAVASLDGAAPRQAEVSVQRGDAADDAVMSRLTATVSEVTSVTGIRTMLTGIASARTQVQQAMMPAQLLSTATAAADTQVRDLLGGAEQILPYLQTANDGANQLVDVAGQVSGMIGQAQGPVAELSGKLTELGLTVGDITTGADEARRGLDEAAVRLTPLDGATAETLRQTSAELAELSGQLTALTGLLGTTVGPDTDLGSALGSGFGQLESVSAQLSSAGNQLQEGIGPIAAQAPALLGEATGQIVAGVNQLKTVSAQVSDQIGKGVNAIPARSGAQQDAVSAAMASPVSVTVTGAGPQPDPLSTRTLMIVFAGTTLALGAAAAWMLVRNTPTATRPVREPAGS